MILDRNNDMKSPTIEKALELVDKEASSIEEWRIKGTGLKFVLMGLAEIQALRLSRLAGMVVKLEETLLDENTIRTLEPKMLFGLYNLASKALTESSEFVERTLKAVDWSELETGLLQIRAQQVTKNQSGIGSEESQDLLDFIARLKAQKDRENTEG